MYGLSCLMEALKQSETMENALNAELELMEGSAASDVKELFIGDDSVENDMDGNGMSVLKLPFQQPKAAVWM